MKIYVSLATILLMTVFLSGCSLGTDSTPGTAISASSIMKTTDAGKSWEPKSKTADKINLAMMDVLSMTINPYDGKNVFVGTLSNGIVKTDDGGENWNLLNFPAGKVYGLAIDSMQSSVMYASGVWQDYGKIFKSVDGGKEWNEVYTTPSKGPVVISLVADKFDPKVLYASVSDGQVMKSVDGGISWQSIFSSQGPITKISIDSASADLIYFLVLGGDILKSTDGGKTRINIAGKIGNGAETIEADPTISNMVYAGGKNGLFRSGDAGENWEELKILNDSKVSPVKAIAINPANPGEIVYGASQAAYKSVDNGQNWSPVQLETKKVVSVIRYDMYEMNSIYLGLRNK